MSLEPQEYEQYSKQIILANVGIYGQKRLKKANVLIVGLGGLGCPIVLYLTSAGIGTIGIIDNDYINISNLNRQILYNKENINNSKALVTSSLIKKNNKKCNILTYTYKLNSSNGYNIINNYDIVIDATDNFETRYIIDEICYKLHKVHIYGAINQYEGQVSVFNYKNYIRYSNLYPSSLKLKNISCEENGILGTMAGIIGILQATECLKIILGIGKVLSGTIVKYNLLSTSIKKVKIHLFKENYNYQQSQDLNNQFLLKIQEINQMNKNQIIILDIREPIDFKNIISIKPLIFQLYIGKLKKTIDLILSLYRYQIIIACNQLDKSLTITNLLLKYNIKSYVIEMSK